MIADHYSCSLHSKIADDELQTARRNASCPRKVACLAQLARFQTDGSFGLVRSACNKLPTTSAAGIAPEGFWLQRKTETLSSGDLLLTLIAWCSAQHSADLAQAGRRQSLADQQHRLF